MAITTYAELQTAVSDWAHRSVSQVTDFIALAETRINSLVYSRVGEVDVTIAATVDSRYIALPSGFMYAHALWRDYPIGTRLQIIYVDPSDMRQTTASSGFPGYYTIDGANIAFEYPNSEAFNYILRYKKGYDIATTLTNDILTNYPDAYLFGALVEASMFARDYAAADRFELRFQESLRNIIITESQNKANTTLTFDGAITKTRSNIYDGGF